MCLVVLHILPLTRLLGTAEDNPHSFTQRFSAVCKFLHRINRRNGRAFVVDHTASVDTISFDRGIKRFHRPAGTGGDHVQVD